MSSRERHLFTLNPKPTSEILAYWGEFLTSPSTALEAINFIKGGGIGAVVQFIANENLIRVYRDGLGQEPVFYSVNKNGLEVSRLQFISDRPNVDEDFFLQVLAEDYSDLQSTADTNVKRLSPGHYLEWDGKTAVEKRWYYPKISDVKGNEADWRAQLKELFHANTQKIVTRETCGLFWSGGLDSNIVALESTGSPLHLFTVSGKWHGTDIAQGSLEFARSRSYPHTHFDLESCIQEIAFEPEVEPFVRYWPGLGTFKPLFNAGKKLGIKTMLTGHGPDDLFSFTGENLAHRVLPFPIYKSLRKLKRRPKIPFGFNERLMNRAFARKWERINRKEQERLSWFKRQLVTRFLYGGSQQLLSEGFNILAERWGMKVRHPLLQQNTFEFALSLPDECFPESERGKEFVRRTYGQFPPTQLTVQDFTNLYLAIYRNEENFIRHYLRDSRLQSHGWVDVPKFLEQTKPATNYEDLGTLYSILYCEQMLEQLG